jgi:DNA-binding transcriptional regulator YdaS (Cro superfamily)
MNLKEYLSEFPSHVRIAFTKQIAQELGISQSYAWNLANGNRVVPAKYADSIQKLTRGKIKKKDILEEVIADHKRRIGM